MWFSAIFFFPTHTLVVLRGVLIYLWIQARPDTEPLPAQEDFLLTPVSHIQKATVLILSKDYKWKKGISQIISYKTLL